MLERIIVVGIGFTLDLLFGDPERLWHPIRAIGACISWTEKMLVSSFKIKQEREEQKLRKQVVGVLLVVIVLLVSVGTPMLLLYVANKINPWLKIGLECIFCYQLLALKSLKTESSKVYDCLKSGTIEQARSAVSRIVGRDTKQLEEEGIIKATVETIAENTSDGVIAPLFFLLLFGLPGGFLYKAVNTMDSMVGYRNDTYCYLGTAAAKLDDVLNYIPARIAAMMMILASAFLGLPVKQAIYIFKRDRYQHASPNSAQTESVCAGALSIQLAGDAYYFGVLHQKPTIGTATRSVEIEDIKRANQLLYLTSILTVLLGMLILSVVHLV